MLIHHSLHFIIILSLRPSSSEMLSVDQPTELTNFRKFSIKKHTINGVPERRKLYLETVYWNPTSEVLALADTGSSLIWGQCSTRQTPFFDPSKSSTNQELPCSSQSCKAIPINVCSSANKCIYQVNYGEMGASQSRGIPSTDTLTIDSSTGQAPLAFPESVFGCAYENRIPQQIAGLVGLGGGPLSLVSQLSAQIDQKFSYCLVPFSSNSTSKLRFGQDAIISGAEVVSSPIVPKSNATFYYLTVEGISVGQKRTKTPQSLGNIINDSGTTLTLLETSFYNELEAIVKDSIVGQTETDPSGNFRLCYGAQLAAANRSLEMVFHFSGDDLLLQPARTFLCVDDLICMSIVPSNKLSIFGDLVQANFQVEYDLQARKVSFAADCS